MGRGAANDPDVPEGVFGRGGIAGMAGRAMGGGVCAAGRAAGIDGIVGRGVAAMGFAAPNPPVAGRGEGIATRVGAAGFAVATGFAIVAGLLAGARDGDFARRAVLLLPALAADFLDADFLAVDFLADDFAFEVFRPAILRIVVLRLALFAPARLLDAADFRFVFFFPPNAAPAACVAFLMAAVAAFLILFRAVTVALFDFFLAAMALSLARIATSSI